jgi:large subunit ribosomal protein L25
MEELQLKAFTRSETGKCPARRLRIKGSIPAILYGHRTESMKLSVNAAELKKLLAKKADKKFFRLLIEADGKTYEKLSIVKHYDMHPLGNQLIHADFYEINMDEKISVDVPVHLKGTPAGVELGGELQQHKRELRLSCLPNLLPEGIDIDIRHLQVGESIKIKDIHLAEGILIQEGEDTTIVYVAATRAAMKAVDEQGGTASQPEVLKQKAPEKKATEKKK